MNAIIATDLDRTMIYSRAAMGDEQFATLETVCVEIYRDAPLSYMAEAAVELLTRLAREVVVVPTTTRTPAQYERITLPGSPFRYAVVSNGGRILVDGADDPVWRARIENEVTRAGATLDEVRNELRTRIDDSWVTALRTADDLFCYLVVDPSAQPPEFLEQWQGWCDARGWTASQQGRKIYATPQPVTKSAAIAEVRRRLVADGTLDDSAELYAAGDGWLDTDLLLAADHAIRPRHGELESLGWSSPGLRVTAHTGALAGVEILRWFGERTGLDPAEPSEPTGRGATAGVHAG